MKTYLKITTLAPLHIGSGEDFVPTGYIIDRGVLYEFDETDFYHELGPSEKRGFGVAADQGLYALKRFYEHHKNLSKKLAFRKIAVSKEIENRYAKQYNKDGTLNNNRLEIAKMAYQGASRLPYIPGSSLKGVIETSLGIYVKKGTNEERQNLQISDFFTDKSEPVCGFAMRRYKYKETSGKGIPVMVEVVTEGNVFWGMVASEKKGFSDRVFPVDEIAHSLETFAKKADAQMFAVFKKKAPKESFVFRIGRFVGQNFIAVGLQKTPVTHSLFSMDKTGFVPFGWVSAQIVSEEEFRHAMDNYVKKSDELIRNMIEHRKKREEERKRKREEAAQKAAQKAAEETRRKAEAEAEATRLASLSPVNRLLEEHDTNELIRMMQNCKIEDYETVKIELARKIKVILQKDPKKWDRAKQKALKRKEFIQSILGES